MSLSINQNIMAMNSYRNLSSTQTSLGKSLEKLSSGFRINRAADDAAGLAISERLRSQVRGNKQAARNAQDGISVIQTAEGALDSVHNILQRMRELAVQGGNGTNAEGDKKNIGDEMVQLREEIDRIAKVTNFNRQQLLIKPAANGGVAPTEVEMTFQVGANETTEDIIKVKFADISAIATNLKEAANVQNAATVGKHDNEKFRALIGVLDGHITTVSTTRSNLGAAQNRFEHTIKNLNVAVENLSASEARIRDTDMAAEMMQFTRNQILSQAGTAMLAQANQVPQGVLSLLR